MAVFSVKVVDGKKYIIANNEQEIQKEVKAKIDKFKKDRDKKRYNFYIRRKISQKR